MQQTNVADLLNRVDELPPLPAVAARVMGMADDDKTSALDLAQVLSTDQALTAKLIKISNSAYYGFARKVSTVREAVVVLGFKQVRQVAVGASMLNSFKKASVSDDVFDLDLFWGHSIAVAVAAEGIAKKTRACRPEDAFTAGVLHDIGRVVLKMTMPGEFRAAVMDARAGYQGLHDAEIEYTGFDHSVVGKALGELWKFPQHLTDAVACHHDANLTPQRDGLAGCVAQADRLALHYGLYCGYDRPGEELQPMPADLAEYEALCGGIDFVLERSFAFIDSASGTPEKWYTRAA
jgi:putative nucleotidyltransferase with HDIG domain